MMTIVTAAIALFTFAMGYALRAAIALPPYRGLPPATARQIRRAQRASRLHLGMTDAFITPANADFDSEPTR